MELIKEAKIMSEKEAILDSASQFTLALLFALSSSVAVLCNTYDHYKDLLEVECSEIEYDRKREALQMIQYQLSKIYDLKQACQSMVRLFRNIGSRGHNGVLNRSKKTKKRRLGRASSNTEKFTQKIQIKAELVALHLTESLTKLLYSTEYIPKKVLWICLTDSSHDALIVSAVKNLQHIEALEPISEVVKLRLNLIKHLATITPYAIPTKYDGTHSTQEESSSIFRRDIARCLRLTSFLLINFPFMKEAMESDELIESFIKLVSEKLRLLCAILISKIDLDQSSETSNNDLSYIFDLYLSVVGYKQPLNRTYEGKPINDSFTVNDFNILVSSFQDHVGDHHTSITSQLLETLSVFAARSGSRILHCMIDIHWNATFRSKYTNGAKHRDATDSPFVLVKLLKSLSCFSPQGEMNTTSEEYRSHQTITKLMKHRCNKFLERHQYLVRSMCRHWGLLALSPRSRRIELFANFLNTLLDKLVEYLRDIGDCLIRKKVDSKKKEELSDDDGEYLPPTTSIPSVYKPSIPTSCDFICLTSSSYPVYLDMLMRMVVSTMALFSIPGEMSSFKKDPTASYTLHPIYELERLAIVYGSLVKLYKDKFHIFPKCLLSSIINISKCMLDVSVTKSQEYIEWRNCQPVLLAEEEYSGGFDPASTTFLKKLLDTFGLYIIGTLRTFCCVHSGSISIQGESIIQIQKGKKLLYGKIAMPGIRSLARKIERTFELLSQTSNRYSTGEIKTDNTVHHTPQHEHKGSEIEISGELQKEIENKIDSSADRKRDFDRSTLIPIVGNYDRSESEDEESFIDNDDESSSCRSDEFGVSGDWGQHIDGSEKEYDSEFFVDRFEKSS